MKVAYIRVSSAEQNEVRQVEALEKSGIEKWFVEKISGKNTNRPKLKEMLAFVREGDTVHIHDLSRLARSTSDLLIIVENFNSQGINLVSNKENIDSSTPTGKLMLTMIGAINQFERENLLERQREGVAIAKREGRYHGRKRAPLPDIYEWKSGKITAQYAMKQLNMSRTSFYRILKMKKAQN